MNEQNRTITAWAAAAIVAAITCLVFLPAVRFPFLPFWDDDIHVHANPHIADLSWSGIGALWAGPWQQLYIPLTYTVWAGLAVLSRRMAGLPVADGALDASWFHGANVVVHTLSAVLAFLLLHRTVGAFFPRGARGKAGIASALGALFFALHPLQVESVAWISGLRRQTRGRGLAFRGRRARRDAVPLGTAADRVVARTLAAHRRALGGADQQCAMGRAAG